MILGCGARRRSKRCLKRFSHGEKVGVLNSSRDDRALMRVRTPRGLTRISREACCRVIGIKMANGASIKGLTDFRLLSSRGYELDGRSPLPFRLSFSLRARDILSIHWILVYPNRGEIRNFRIEGSSDIVGLPGNMIKFRGSRLSGKERNVEYENWASNQFTDSVFTPSRRAAVTSPGEGSGWHAIIMRDYCWTESYLGPLSGGPIWAYLNSRTRSWSIDAARSGILPTRCLNLINPVMRSRYRFVAPTQSPINIKYHYASSCHRSFERWTKMGNITKFYFVSFLLIWN